MSTLSTRDKLSFASVGLLPLLALIGNAVADIALVINVVVLMATYGSDLKIFAQSWFLRLSIAFWAWILICSALSMFPAHSFQDSLPWIRFPLYAFALSIFLARGNGAHIKIFIGSAVLGTIIEFAFMLHEYIYMRQAYPRLHGTFQKFTPSWYIVCFGLIAVLWLFQQLKTKPIRLEKWIASALFLFIAAYGMLISGELQNTMIFLLTISLFFLVQKKYDLNRVAMIVIGLAAFLALFSTIVWQDAALHERVMNAVMIRLPWLSTSDYAAPLVGGFYIAELNPVFGVGPKNTFAYCTSLQGQGMVENFLHITECPWHPHNLYLQVAAEAGIIGLILFSALALYIVGRSVLHFIKDRNRNNLPIILAPILFFPLQTYSQAFGQSKNFYLWTAVGFVLYLIRLQLKERGKDGAL